MSENQMVIEGVTVNRKNYLHWRETTVDTVPVGISAPGGTYDELAAYVARGIARQRREEVVTLRHDSTSVTGREVDSQNYQLTTGAPNGNGWSINYRPKWFSIDAHEAGVVEDWVARSQTVTEHPQR